MFSAEARFDAVDMQRHRGLRPALHQLAPLLNSYYSSLVLW